MDLSTTYLGLKLKNPLVASSSPLSRTVQGIAALERAGAAAVVMPSLFEEHIELDAVHHDEFLDAGAESFPEALSYLPKSDPKMFGPDEYLQTIERAKRIVKVPLIASLNGSTSGGWTRHARLIQDAGADALELNLYYLPTNLELSAAEIEHRYFAAVQAVVGHVTIPVAVKIGPFLSSLPNFAQEIEKLGASALVMFNRFYQPDFDLERLEVVPGLTLSRSEDLRLPLRWTAILAGRTKLDLAVTTGVHTHIDVLKSVMAGASVAMMASELLEHGLGRIGNILVDMEHWMQVHEYESIRQMRGSMSQENIADPAIYERANYMKVLYSYRPTRDVPYAVPLGRRPA